LSTTLRAQEPNSFPSIITGREVEIDDLLNVLPYLVLIMTPVMQDDTILVHLKTNRASVTIIRLPR